MDENKNNEIRGVGEPLSKVENNVTKSLHMPRCEAWGRKVFLNKAL